MPLPLHLFDLVNPRATCEPMILSPENEKAPHSGFPHSGLLRPQKNFVYSRYDWTEFRGPSDPLTVVSSVLFFPRELSLLSTRP
jgi:hypothetical protein